MKSLQTKIFLLFIMLLILVQAIALWTLLAGKQIQENQAIQNQLTTAKTIFSELFNSRSDYLVAFSETVAKDYGIKQVFDEDTRSLLVALNNHRKRLNADLAMTISAQGKITGQLLLEFNNNGRSKVRQGKQRDQDFPHPNWLENQGQSHLYIIDNAVYQLSLSPMTVGSKTIGWIAFGFQIDQRLASEFKDITGLETDFVIKHGEFWRMVTSSSSQPKLAFAKDIIMGQTPKKYIAVGYLLSEFDTQQFGVAMYGLRADFVEVLQKQWWQFLVLAIITLLLSLTSAFWIAASITKPIIRLVKQAKTIADGNYQQTIVLNDKSELGQLADEFNLMQKAVLVREQAISHRADHDPITDLPNRNVLNLTLDQLIAQNNRFGLFHINLSNLKDVNDTLGHSVGDDLIKEMAYRLSQTKCFHLVCHAGGDEFILLCDLSQERKWEDVVSTVSQLLEPHFDYQGIYLQLQVRIGIVLYPEHGEQAKTLIQRADTALHYTRKSHQAIQLYHADLNVNSIERLSLINDLKEAIAGGQLQLYYQPKLNLSSGIVTHVEALVRWKHPTLGMIMPDSFIHIAEKTGQINALTRWVFTTALDQFNDWRKAGLDLNIAINVSAENLKDPSFYHFICQSLQSAQVPSQKITLEITESAVVEDPSSAIALLSQFKAYGLRISIDDYGTGYSSLAQLKQLPLHELKVDKSFVQRLKDDEDDQIIVSSTIELAHNMSLYVVAEGIEDEFALNWLTTHHCELGQGYFISRPKPSEEVTLWLKQQLVQDK